MLIKKLVGEDINQEYLDTLNDSDYMQFSRNSGLKHSRQSQLTYVESFRNQTSKPQSLLFGIFENHNLVGTMTVNLDFEKTAANIGILVFRNYSKTGIGKKALIALTLWVRAKFPMFRIEVGMSTSNLAMQKLAISCGYKLRKPQVSNLVYFDYPKYGSDFLDLALGKQDEEVLFFGTDIGGVEALLEFYVRATPRKSLVVQGSGLTALEYYGLNYYTKFIDLKVFSSLLFSTGADYSQSQSLLKDFHLSKKKTICVLDHWVNYKTRFNSPIGLIPKLLIATNEIALDIARKTLPTKEILLSPDFRLERLKCLLPVDVARVEKFVLVILEPERPNLEGLGSITQADILSSIKKTKSIAAHLGVNRIHIRQHPAMGANTELLDIISKDSSVSLSHNSNLEDDLTSSIAVVGFSSSVLFFSARLGIPTYTLSNCAPYSWLGRCKEILKLV
jgi:RimJ/RimL family protein N-acetyltransferase